MTSETSDAKARALLVAMKDFHPDYEAETNIWLDYDHIPERLSCDGIESCQRLELYPLRPAGWDPTQQWLKYLSIYSLRSLETLQSPAYKLQKQINDRLGSLMRQNRRARKRAERSGKDRSLRTIWSERKVPWDRRRELAMPSPRVCLLQFRNSLGALDQPVNDFIDTQLVPELLSLPGFLGCERFEAGVTDIEKHSAPPLMHPVYMDIYDISTPEILVSGPYRDHLASIDYPTPDIQRACTPSASGIYVERPSPWRPQLS